MALGAVDAHDLSEARGGASREVRLRRPRVAPLATVVLPLLFSGCAIERSGLGTADGGSPADAARDAGPLDGGRADAPPIRRDTGPAIPADWFDARWGARVRLTFDNTPHDQDLVDFPALVVLDPTRLDYARAGEGGAQVRFVDPDGTALAYEIEHWQADGASSMWVRVPRIDAGSGTDFIWLYYDAPGESDAQDPPGGLAPGRGLHGLDRQRQRRVSEHGGR